MSVNTMDAARRLIRAATGEEYGDGDMVTDITVGYAEPGYGGLHSDTAVVVFGNWNPKRFVRDGDSPLTNEESLAPRLAAALERIGVEIEWLDEWTTCSCCHKAVRTQPDSYSWTRYYVEHDEYTSLICLDCFEDGFDDDEGLREYGFVNDPERVLPDHISDNQLIDWGWEKHNGTFENGWYGREDNPVAIFNRINDEADVPVDVVFKIDENQQFCLRFTAWVKPVNETVEV